MQQRFDEWLEARLQERGWQAADLNRASMTADYPRGFNPGLISRWRKPPPIGVVPNPPTLDRLALVFKVPRVEVYAAAGRLLSDATAARAVEPDLIEQYIRQGTAQMPAVLVGIPRKMWGPIIKLTFDRAIDGARDMAALLLEQQAQPRSAKNRNEPRATTNRPVRSTGANRGRGELRLPERVAAFALAGA
jgi:hypothetical protein